MTKNINSQKYLNRYNLGEVDKNHKFPMDKILKIGELGFMGIAVDSEYGMASNNPRL